MTTLHHVPYHAELGQFLEHAAGRRCRRRALCNPKTPQSGDTDRHLMRLGLAENKRASVTARHSRS